jgi:predicted ATPase
MTKRRIVLTGGPGAGKTAVLEMARRSLCEHAVVLPESASVVFGGGFPREKRVGTAAAAQRAIFHVQRELETSLDDRDEVALVLCDRGTLDGLAYWPRAEADFWRELGTTREENLARYDLVIHLRPPPEGDGYHGSTLRTETAAEAADIDLRIETAWDGHPRRVFIDSTHDFIEKLARVLVLIGGELPEPCRGAQLLRHAATHAPAKKVA